MQFKIFKAGEFTEADINAFFAENIILKDKYLENGDIYVFYKHKSRIGGDPISEIEALDRAVTKAETEIADARLDILDFDTQLADIEEKIKKAHPNEKKEWDALQAERSDLQRQRLTAQKTIDGRNINILNLREEHQRILKNESVKGKKAA